MANIVGLNIPQLDIGQGGSAYLDTADLFTPPTGKVVVAINVVKANSSFTTITPANEQGFYTGTSVTATAAGNGTNAQAIAEADNFPEGQWIYGRFSGIQLADTNSAAFVYFAE